MTFSSVAAATSTEENLATTARRRTTRTRLEAKDQIGTIEAEEEEGKDLLLCPNTNNETLTEQKGKLPVDSTSIASQDSSPGSENITMTVETNPFFLKFIFALLGIGLLVPWNAFISAKPYFEQRTCSVNNNDLELWFGFVYNIASVLSLALMIGYDYLCLGQRQSLWIRRVLIDPVFNLCGCKGSASGDESSASSSYYMVVLPLFIYFLVFASMVILVFLPNVDPQAFFAYTLVSLGICGIMVAIASAGVVATANRFPAHVGLGPLFSGQAVGGVLVSVANFVASDLFEANNSYWKNNCDIRNSTVVAMLQREDTPTTTCSMLLQNHHHIDWAAFTYFLIGCLLLLGCIVGYNYIEQSFQYQPLQNVETCCAETKANTSQTNGSLESSSPRMASSLLRDKEGTSSSSYNGTKVDDEVFYDAEEATDSPATSETDNGNLTYLVWTQVQGPALSIFFNFLITLSIFPAWTSSLLSARQCQSTWRLWNDLYVPFTFVCFNIFDLIGRLLAERQGAGTSSRQLVSLTLARSIFFFLFAILPSSNHLDNHAPLFVIHSDVFSFLVQMGFGLTNGWIITLSFIHAPTLLRTPDNLRQDSSIKDVMSEISSKLLNFAVSFGLLSGSLLSFVYSGIASGR